MPSSSRASDISVTKFPPSKSFLFGRWVLAVTADNEFFFLTDQRLASCLVIGNMGDDSTDALAIKLPNALLPFAVTVVGPLKRKLAILQGS